MFKKSKKGFTIVELVIVIAVIGILSAILIPTFANLTKNAEQTALKSNLANAYSLYASEAADGKRSKPMSSVSSAVTIEWEEEIKIEFAPQEKVFLVNKKATNPATSNGYVYTNGAWGIEEVAYALGGTKTLVADDADVALSTFGDYIVYYAKVTA